jgi:hypothetical protein
VLSAARLVRLFGFVVGAGLLLEGGLLLLVDGLRVALPELPFATGDARHNALHVVWGVAILGLLLNSRAPRRAVAVVGVFGFFYTALAIVGVLVDAPLGLALGPGENVFHFTVGPLGLALSAWAAVHRAASPSPNSDSSAASVSSAAPGSTSGGTAAPR